MKIDQNILDNFWQEKCSKDEVRMVLKWFNSIESEIYFGQHVDYCWQNYQKIKIFKVVTNKTYLDILKNINSQSLSLIDNNAKYNQSKIKLRIITKIAAVILIIILASIVVKAIIHIDINRKIEAQKIEWKEKSTRPGQKLTLFLSDGSKVILNAGSIIRYANIFNDSARTVFLQGEAFFDVAHDTLRPFSVVSGQVTTTALGTSFNIRNYHEEQKMEVSLQNGRVKIENKNERLVLDAGEGISINEAGFSKVYQYHPKEVMDWKNGIIHFKDANSNEIIKELERWYGVDIKLQTKLNKKLYTGEFANMNLEEVLQGLSYVKKFTF